MIEHPRVTGLAGLQALLMSIRKDQALVHGVVKGSSPGDVRPLVTTEVLKQTKPDTLVPGTVARSLEFLAYPDDHFLLMFDRDDHEEDPTKLQTAEDLFQLLAPLLPGIAEAGALVVLHLQRHPLQGHPGMAHSSVRLSCVLLGEGNLTRFVDLLTVRLWNAGYGYCMLASPNRQTGVSAVLVRVAVDLAVYSPERLDYVSGARIAKQAPFYQDRADPVLMPGTVLDLDAFPT